MVDIHTHVLPQIDDGAKDAELSLRMLEEEAAQGVNKVVLTPHYYGRQYSPREFLRRREDSFAKIKDIAPKEIQLYLGAEVRFSGALAETEEIEKLSIANTRYILIELPFDRVWEPSLMEKLRYFIGETDLTPIIAHFCRYEEVKKDPSLLLEFVRSGCLLQMNASAFLDKSQLSFAFAALRRGFVHCICSDCHDMQRRPPEIAAAKQAIEEAGHAELFRRTEEITNLILEDRPIPYDLKETGKPMKKFLGKYV